MRAIILAALLGSAIALLASVTITAERIEISGPGGGSITVQRPMLRSAPLWQPAAPAADKGSS